MSKNRDTYQEPSASPSQSSLPRTAPDVEDLKSQLGVLRNLAALLTLACLIVSICFNVYVVSANAKLQERTVSYEQLVERHDELRRFLHRFTRDLIVYQQQSRAIQEVLHKYGADLETYGLAVSRAPGPQPTPPSN